MGKMCHQLATRNQANHSKKVRNSLKSRIQMSGDFSHLPVGTMAGLKIIALLAISLALVSNILKIAN